MNIDDYDDPERKPGSLQIMDSDLQAFRASQVESNQRTALLAADESSGTKLLREAYVFGVGTATGIGSGIADKVTNPGTTAVEAVGAYALGYGLGALQRKIPGLRLVGAALTYAAIKDVAVRSESLGGIWSDTWNCADNVDKNKQGVEKTLGHFIVDTAFTTAVGGLGARRGAATARLNDLYRTLEAHNFDSNCIGTVRVCHGNGGISHGSAFALDDRRIVTSAHVIGRDANYCMSAYSAKSSAEKSLKLLKANFVTDIAILESQTPHGIKPLKLAESLPAINTDVVAIGSRQSGSGYRTFLPREGKFKGERHTSAALMERESEMTSGEKAMGSLMNAWRVFNGTPGSKIENSQTWAWATQRLRSGMSGGPLLDTKTMEVVGVNSFSIRNWISGFSTVKDVRAILTEAGLSHLAGAK